MKILKGKYASAKVFTDNIEETASKQIIELMNQEFVSGAKIRIMPDTHAGAGCVIGFTADLGDKVIPNLVGVDIGCGMLCVSLGKIDFRLKDLDNMIQDFVPHGHEIHREEVSYLAEVSSLISIDNLRSEKFQRAIGSLGGGNHFIEIDIDDEGNKYLVIHSGSRNLGKQVADFYQNLAVESCKGLVDLAEVEQETIKKLKNEGNQHSIQLALKNIKNDYLKAQPAYPKELCFLTGESREEYLHDMSICQEYASLNRFTMANIILDKMFGAKAFDFQFFTSVHNYINFEDNIIRKGACSAYGSQQLIIPINMRDGSILAVGKGNADWNFSAPHGAGRLMGRMEAKRKLSLSIFEEQMEGIYTTTANESTLDESPMAYKPMQEIIDNIGDTVEIQNIIKPIYNFKSSE